MYPSRGKNTMQTATKEKTGKKQIPAPLTKREKIKLFKEALENAIEMQMNKDPLLFHGSVHANKKYPSEFAKHMMEKLQEGRVLVLNETVVAAAKMAGIDYGIDALYKYFDFDPPKAEEVPEEAPVMVVERSFRGC